MVGESPLSPRWVIPTPPRVIFRFDGHKFTAAYTYTFKPLLLSVTKQRFFVTSLQNWFSNTSINETLVREGIAVTKHVKGLRDNPQYNKLLPKLLKAEVRAEKKGAGIWTKPSTWERFKAMFLWWRTE